MSYKPDKPYNNLPLLPPDAVIETPAVLKMAISANRVLGELKGKSESLPNPEILINSIVLQEARTSSEIENVITTNDRLYTALTASDAETDPHTREVLRYREALKRGTSIIREKPLSTNIFIGLMQIIKETDAGIRSQPGTVIANPKTRKIIYWPPEGEERIRQLLKNLEDYIHENVTGHDPLIKMAVSHYQFEAIHPFDDGNGRTGRILNILFLLEKGLLHQPVLYLSDHIIRNKSAYYRLLRDVTEKRQWEPWILFMLEGVEKTSRRTMKRIDQILSLLDETIQTARSKLPARVYSKELIELLFEQPYCKVKTLTDRGIAKRQTAAEYLRELESAGILKSKQVGRENLFINTTLYELLQAIQN